MPDMVRLDPQGWRALRRLRLSALLDSPECFLSTHAKEAGFSAGQWRAEFVRGDWHVCAAGTAHVGLIGVTHEHDGPGSEQYIEYLWVAPSYRRQGIASAMLATVLGHLRTAGTRTALLWILDGNEAAMRLYQKAGFVPTGISQPIESRPGRREEKMRLTLE